MLKLLKKEWDECLNKMVAIEPIKICVRVTIVFFKHKYDERDFVIGNYFQSKCKAFFLIIIFNIDLKQIYW